MCTEVDSSPLPLVQYTRTELTGDDNTLFNRQYLRNYSRYRKTVYIFGFSISQRERTVDINILTWFVMKQSMRTCEKNALASFIFLTDRNDNTLFNRGYLRNYSRYSKTVYSFGFGISQRAWTVDMNILTWFVTKQSMKMCEKTALASVTSSWAQVDLGWWALGPCRTSADAEAGHNNILTNERVHMLACQSTLSA